MKRLLTVGILALFSLTVSAKELSGVAPDFSLKNLAGETVKLSDYKGQVVMINFWASWCGPCRQEMPLLNDMSEELSKAGFVLLGVNLDEDVNDARKFLNDIGDMSFPILLDPTAKVADLYKNQAMPSSYFVDREGNLAFLHQGYRKGEEAEYRAVAKKLLAK